MSDFTSPNARWRRIQRALATVESATIERANGRIFLGADSREALRSIPSETIDGVITSPPYAQLKDYGTEIQLGFGQETRDEYLRDIGTVLHELHRVCVSGAALWVVLDTTKKGGKTLLLPWEVIHRAEEEGWLLQDVVIWDKGHNLPWSHVGYFRGVFEYVLLFSKEKLKRFALNEIRESDDLSPYWLKYPERFHPDGKAPSDLWHFPIPVQGSWSQSSVRHFCPFPLGMVARMVTLTTERGSIIIDPFAGTGSVLTVATFLGRRGIGIDINHQFVTNYGRDGHKALLAHAKQQLASPGKKNGTRNLRQIIGHLRVLKYPKTLFAQLLRPDRVGNTIRESIAAFLVVSTKRRGVAASRRMPSAKIYVLARKGAPLVKLRSAIQHEISRPPLSKFGLTCEVVLLREPTWRSRRFLEKLPAKSWYVYTKGAFHQFDSSVHASELNSLLIDISNDGPKRIPPIIGTIRVDLPLTIH